MLKQLIFCCSILISLDSHAQQFSCGFDYLKQYQNPEQKQKEENANNFLYERALGSISNLKSQQTILQIPVVFHIVHQGGMENISDSTVIAAIDQLNLRFQNAAPYYDSTGHPINIQFCLASVDPQGHPTTGITRDSSVLTFLNASDDAQLKSLDRWDTHYYYNIWSVAAIFGFPFSVSGYSTLPSSAGDSTDGVVVYWGALNNYVLSHESGHYLGLYHTFNSGNCINYNCLLDGDQVCDTPPDTSTSTCMDNSCTSDADDTTGFSPFTTDVNDLPNYMDYTPCPLSFSQGQADRMNNALNVLRGSLLQSVGCGFSGSTVPVAQISYAVSPCNDGLVYFSDSLSTNANMVSWDFNNDGVFESSLHNPAYAFPATGTYTVKLIALSSGGADSITQIIFVQKSPTQYYPIITMNGIFQVPGSVWKSCGDYTVNCIAAPAQSYLWSTGETTQSISFIPDSTFTLTLTIIDSAGLTWSNQLWQPLIVYVYPLPTAPVIYSTDSLTVCTGDTITIHSNVNGTGFTYNWYKSGSQIIGAYDSILTVIASGFDTYQLIIEDTNYCYNYSNILWVYAYDPPLVQSLIQNNFQLISGWGNGNQWFMNGDTIAGATGTTLDITQNGCYSVAWFFSAAPQCYTMSDTICFTTLDLSSIHPGNSFSIFPVPAADLIHINGEAIMEGSHYKITDPAGRIVMKGKIESQNAVINIAGLAKGAYFFDTIVANQRSVRVLMKK
ncbi:MAG: M43 family zinc metalloprotease [Bacteroidia bacterium]